MKAKYLFLLLLLVFPFYSAMANAFDTATCNPGIICNEGEVYYNNKCGPHYTNASQCPDKEGFNKKLSCKGCEYFRPTTTPPTCAPSHVHIDLNKNGKFELNECLPLVRWIEWNKLYRMYDHLSTAMSPIVYDPVTKRVGIGISTPSTALHVNPRLEENTLTLGRRSGMASISSTPEQHMIIESLNRYLSLNHWSKDNVIFAFGGGNVGIGTTNPTSKLHVAGKNNFVTIDSLKGANNALLTVNKDGKLERSVALTPPAPGRTGYLTIDENSQINVSTLAGDNLGNHTATKDLNMNGKNIINIANLIANGTVASKFLQAGNLSGGTRPFNVDNFGRVVAQGITVGSFFQLGRPNALNNRPFNIDNAGNLTTTGTISASNIRPNQYTRTINLLVLNTMSNKDSHEGKRIRIYCDEPNSIVNSCNYYFIDTGVKMAGITQFTDTDGRKGCFFNFHLSPDRAAIVEKLNASCSTSNSNPTNKKINSDKDCASWCDVVGYSYKPTQLAETGITVRGSSGFMVD